MEPGWRYTFLLHAPRSSQASLRPFAREPTAESHALPHPSSPSSTIIRQRALQRGGVGALRARLSHTLEAVLPLDQAHAGLPQTCQHRWLFPSK